MYVILGATGNTGSAVAKTLLAKGQKVRVVGRDKSRLAQFVNQSAEAFEGDVLSTESLTKAFIGAKAVYAMVPPVMNSTDFRAYQDQVTEAIARALEAARVTHAVTLSSIGADKPEKTGPVVGLHKMEERFNRIAGLNVLHLRAGYFMENTLAQTGVIRNFGMMAGPVSADLALPMIATRDIGAAAAEALLALSFSGHQARELLGQRDITYSEVAKLAGAAIGKPGLAYTQLPSEMMIQAMTQMGISANMAGLLCEMSDSLNSGYMRALEPRTAVNTTPTSFETFVQEVFVPAFRGSAATA
jgi:uncharacterized protein YbjT (DUF2867 family)